jgi:hypothetical protein
MSPNRARRCDLESGTGQILPELSVPSLKGSRRLGELTVSHIRRIGLRENHGPPESPARLARLFIPLLGFLLKRPKRRGSFIGSRLKIAG